MFFKNLTIYRLPIAIALATAMFEEQLAAHAMQPCGATEPQRIGWVPPRGAGALTHVANQQILLALGTEQKILPASVVKQFANDKAKAIEEAEGRRVGRKELREIREAMTLELLPRAFVRRRTTFGWIDPVNGWIVLDAAAPARAEEFLELLRKSVDDFPVRLLQVAQSPASAMTGWVAAGEAPAGFTIDQDLDLASAENAKVRYLKHTLEGGEVREHIAAGHVATKLALTWGDRISFVLTERLQLKRLAFLDILKESVDGQAENEDERFDLDFTLMAGETARLLSDLVAALGGEIASEPDLVTHAEAAQKEVRNAADNLEALALEDGVTATLSGPTGEVLATFGDADPLYEQAVGIVLENRRASISLVQRHLTIGYNRAARLIESMEKAGVVSTMDSQGARKVLVAKRAEPA